MVYIPMPIRYKQGMDLRRLRTFVTVAEQGTVSKAAIDLHIAQPALSRQIGDLERELGLKLFDRIGRRLVLTADGEQLLGSCRSMLGHVGSLTNRRKFFVAETRDVEGSGLADPDRIRSFNISSTFAPCYPDVQVKLIESVGDDTLAMMERGEIHLCISLLDVSRPTSDLGTLSGAAS